MGRPRIGSQITSQENNINGNIIVSGVLSESLTPVSSSTDIHHEQRGSHLTESTSVTPATRALIIAQRPADGSLAEQGLCGHGTQHDHVSSVSNQGSQQPRTKPWDVSHHLPAVVHARSPLQPNFPERQEINQMTAFQTNASNTNGPVTTTDSVTDCHITILRRTTKLEESLLMTTPAPSIDLVLETEQDLRGLQQRCFACTGHEKVGRSCLQSDRPVFLSLSLLAERVVTMLEETFRLAVHRTSTTYEGTQDLLVSPTPVTASRRIDRSFRGLLNLPCVFPIATGNMDIRVGNHVVDGPVQARAVKKILQLRTQKLLQVLREMRAGPQLNRSGKSISGPLDWGGSAGVLDDAAGILIKDLIRRMEALQGGLTLMG